MRGRVWPLAMAALLVLVFTLRCVAREARAADSSSSVARVRVFQTYDVPVSGLQSEFEYLIEATEEDAPLPLDESGAPLSSFTLRRDAELWLEFLVVTDGEVVSEARTYHYVLRPQKTELNGGLYYVDAQSSDLRAGVNVYALEIYVLPAEEEGADPIVVPTVHCDDLDGPKVTDPGWRIGYTEPEVDPSPGDVIVEPGRRWDNPLLMRDGFIGNLLPGISSHVLNGGSPTERGGTDGGRDGSSGTSNSNNVSSTSGNRTAGSGSQSGSQGTQAQTGPTTGATTTDTTRTPTASSTRDASTSYAPSTATTQDVTASGTSPTQVSGSSQPLGATADRNVPCQALAAMTCAGALLLAMALRVRRVGGNDV